ncbi:MAG TPA: hypothetical protein VGD91_14980, partial [Trebonia sp.]
RDLPVLIVATAETAALEQAVAGLSGALLSQPVHAETCDGNALAPGDEPLADGAVALFNQGTPSGVVTPDGTLWMSLMRACSGWPSGVWIDGDRRTAPDGSSFAWQHWSHTYRYALASSARRPDWRGAGFNAAAEDYNHALLTVVGAGPFPGAPAPAALEILDGPAMAPMNHVTLSALKPHGNPLAAGRDGTPSPARREVTVRLRETDGLPGVAGLRMAAGIEAAWRADLLEEPAGGPLTVRDGTALVPLLPFETVTVTVRLTAPGFARPAPQAGAAAEAAALEPAQPVYTRYWLHGKGPAPAGNLPVAVHFSPTRVTLGGAGADGPALALTVACGPVPAAGQVELLVPEGLAVTVAGPDGASAPPGPLRYQLNPNGFAAWDVTVSAAPGTAGGRYFVTARITDARGQQLEDTALVTVGEPGGAEADLPPQELFARLQSDVTALIGEVALEVLTPAVRLAPGAGGELAVRVSSTLASPLRGEVQLISPVGTWRATGPWTQPVTAEPGGEATVRFAVSAPATAEPGWESWLLVKLMYFGRVRYSEAVPLTISPPDGS